MNELIFLTQTLFLTVITLVSLYWGSQALIAALALYAVLANLFVTKQIVLFGLNVTPSDAYMVVSIIGLNLVQEYFGAALAKRAIWISFGAIITYTVASQLQLLYFPSSFDTTQIHFCAILSVMPRIALASCIVYLLVQYLDRWLYATLQRKNIPFLIRNYAALAISQFIDTLLFSFAGLYGIVHNVWHIVLVSYTIKLISIALCTPLLVLAKKMIKKPN